MTLPHGVVLGVDVGGTGIKARLTDTRTFSAIAEYRVPTPQNDPGAALLAEAVADLVVQARGTLAIAGVPDEGPPFNLAAVGVVVPGIVDEAGGTAVLAINLGWRDVPVLDCVRAALRRRGITIPVAFGHDVRSGALAEIHAPDASTSKERLRLQRGSVAFVPVGTGLASALAVDGSVVSGDGWAGEIGQVRLPFGPHAGSRVEEIASAGAVARRAGVQSALDAVTLVRQADPHAISVWRDCIQVLATALTWTTAVAGCHTIILGGGLTKAGAILLDPLRTAVTEQLAGLRPPDIVPARHGDASGAIGAALLAHGLLSTTAPAGSGQSA